MKEKKNQTELHESFALQTTFTKIKSHILGEIFAVENISNRGAWVA